MLLNMHEDITSAMGEEAAVDEEEGAGSGEVDSGDEEMDEAEEEVEQEEAADDDEDCWRFEGRWIGRAVRRFFPRHGGPSDGVVTRWLDENEEDEPALYHVEHEDGDEEDLEEDELLVALCAAATNASAEPSLEEVDAWAAAQDEEQEEQEEHEEQEEQGDEGEAALPDASFIQPALAAAAHTPACGLSTLVVGM